MAMLHRDVLTLSYKFRYEIMRALDGVLGYLGLTHFSLDLVRPDGEMLFFSGTPSHGYDVCVRGFGGYDSTIAPESYQNHSFYWWDQVQHTRFGREINFIKKVRHHFECGFMLVRYWDGFYLIYSFASDHSGPDYQNSILEARDQLLQAGDHVYTLLRDIYSEYAGAFVPPLIHTFYPFIDGKPCLRISPFKKRNGLFLPEGPARPHLKLIVDND
jgi:hypothetical protein